MCVYMYCVYVMFVYVYVYIYVCICVCVYMYMCVHVYVCMYVCICLYVYVYVCMHMCACVYMYICVCICVYAYVCIPIKRKWLFTEMGQNMKGVWNNIRIFNAQVFIFVLIIITKWYSSKPNPTGLELIAYQTHGWMLWNLAVYPISFVPMPSWFPWY